MQLILIKYLLNTLHCGIKNPSYFEKFLELMKVEKTELRVSVHSLLKLLYSNILLTHRILIKIKTGTTGQ